MAHRSCDPIPGRDPEWRAPALLVLRRRLAAAVILQAVQDCQAGDLEACRWLQEGGADVALWADAADVDPGQLRAWAWAYERAHRRRHGWEASTPTWVRLAAASWA